jgi:hypothetical protein
MGMYKVVRTSASLSVGADFLTITAAAGKPLNIWSIDLNGLARASLEGELILQRSTGGATAAVTIVPARDDPAGPAASFLARAGWTTQPTLTSDTILWGFGVNANGGKDRFPGYPQPIPVPAGGQLSLRCLQGNHAVNQTWWIEELG